MRFALGYFVVLFFGLAFYVRIPWNPFQQPRDDKAEIEALVDRYYSALREERYPDAVACYAEGAFKDFPMNPADALKAASRLTGVPMEMPTIEALRIDGDEAVGEIVIQRQGLGGVSIVMQEEKSGKRVGTHARTLHFIREKGDWKISGKDKGPYARQAEKALVTLQKARRNQEENSRRLVEMLKTPQQ